MNSLTEQSRYFYQDLDLGIDREAIIQSTQALFLDIEQELDDILGNAATRRSSFDSSSVNFSMCDDQSCANSPTGSSTDDGMVTAISTLNNRERRMSNVSEGESAAAIPCTLLSYDTLVSITYVTSHFLSTRPTHSHDR